eukprot:1398358-Pyramimonas_sp.AAC.1
MSKGKYTFTCTERLHGCSTSEVVSARSNGQLATTAPNRTIQNQMRKGGRHADDVGPVGLVRRVLQHW